MINPTGLGGQSRRLRQKRRTGIPASPPKSAGRADSPLPFFDVRKNVAAFTRAMAILPSA